MSREKMQEVKKKEQFVKLAREVFPLVEQIRAAMSKSDFGESASITLGSDGYMEFHPYDSDWRMNRYRGDEVPVAQYEYRERISLEEGK